MRHAGSAMAIAVRAARTRSRASETALSGNPTMEKVGTPGGLGALHFDKARLDPLECDGIGARDHAGPRNFTSPG